MPRKVRNLVMSQPLQPDAVHTDACRMRLRVGAPTMAAVATSIQCYESIREQR